MLFSGAITARALTAPMSQSGKGIVDVDVSIFPFPTIRVPVHVMSYSVPYHRSFMTIIDTDVETIPVQHISRAIMPARKLRHYIIRDPFVCLIVED